MKRRLLSVALAGGILFSTASYAQTTLYGITNANTIFTLSDVSSPSTSMSGPYTVSGITTGQALVGIDSRPGNGGLYALGYDSIGHTAELYRLTNSGTTYTATAVSGTLASMDLGLTNNVAIDFVSTADNQLRIIGRNGNNYIMNADNGAIMTTGTSGLSFGLGDLHIGSGIMAATAYTNNYYGADETQEVGYDAVNNVLVMMDAGAFNNGFNNASNMMHSIGLTVGTVLDGTASIGMDTWFDTLTHNNTIYLTGNTLLGGAHLYKYSMTSGLTGTITDMGAIGDGSLNVRDIAFQTYRDSTSAISGRLLTGLSLNLRNLVYFDSHNPGNIRRMVTLNGMTSGQTMVGIDYAASGSLYGLGYNGSTHTYQLYTIDSATGHVTAVNATAGSLNLGTDDGSNNYVNAGFRFISTANNRIRVMGNNVNAQIDATTGAIVATDTALQYVTGDAAFGTTADLTSFAYTGYNGDATTQMFGFDANTGAMVKFNSGNGTMGFGNGSSGYINTDVSLNTVLSLFGHTSGYNNSYINIAYDSVTASNVGYIAANYQGDSSGLLENYAVLYDMSDMLTAYSRGTNVTPAEIGRIGYGTPVKDITMRRSANTTAGPEAVATVAGGFNDLLVYPNPVISSTRVVLDQVPGSDVFVDIIDMNGQVDRTFQYAAGTYQLDVDMSNLPTGLYSVRVSGRDIGYHNLKVIKE